MLNKIKGINLKGLLRAGAILWALAFIIVMTITNVGIDPEFNWVKWAGNSMILFGIAVFGLFMGESVGIDKQKEKTNYNQQGEVVGGLYQKSLYEYNVFRKLIDDLIIYFPLFYDWFVPQRLESKQSNYLIMNNVRMGQAHNIVKYCTMEDYAEMKLHPIIKHDENGKEVIIAKLLEREYEPVKEVLDGSIKLELSGTAYYLQAYAESNNKDIIEQGEAIKQQRKYNKKSSRAIRLISGAFVSLALGILTVNDFMRGDDTQAWVNLIVRITNMFTALLSGYLSGVVDVKLEAGAIANKTEVLRLFKSAYDKHLFKLYTEEELNRKEWEKYQKDMEEAKANVVDPVPNEENDIALLPTKDV